MEVLKELYQIYQMPAIKLQHAACMANTLPAVLSLFSQVIFKVTSYNV